jgi:hypothetical protein
MMTEFEIAYLQRLNMIATALDGISTSLDRFANIDPHDGRDEIADGLKLVANSIEQHSSP